MKKPERKPSSDKNGHGRDVDFDTDKYLEELRKKLVVEQKPHQSPKPKKLFAILLVSLMLLLAGALVIINPSLIGLVAQEKEFGYNDTISGEFVSNSEYIWEANNPGILKSIRLYGKYLNGTRAKVYIENEGSRYLILDTEKLGHDEISSITAFAVHDGNNETEMPANETIEVPANETEFNQALEINETESAANETIDQTPEINETLPINTTIPSNDTIPANITPIANETTPINETPINETIINETINTTPENELALEQNELALKQNELALEQNGLNELILKQNELILKQNELILKQNELILKQNELILNKTINKSISIQLEYNKNTPYDENDDGVEQINSIIDFTVDTTAFNWNYEASSLCTRWEVYSSEDEKLTTSCYGSENCCAQLGLLPERDNWDDELYLSYNSLGAAYNNIVSARVIYYNETEIILSSWANLSARFEEEGALSFENVCEETCSVTGFNKSGYKLVIEVENGKIILDKISYAVIQKFANSAPQFVKNISGYSILKGSNTTIDLSEHFFDADDDVLQYSWFENDNINISLEGNIATIAPNSNFTGIAYTFFIANDTEDISISNVFMIDAAEPSDILFEFDDGEITSIDYYVGLNGEKLKPKAKSFAKDIDKFGFVFDENEVEKELKEKDKEKAKEQNQLAEQNAAQDAFDKRIFYEVTSNALYLKSPNIRYMLERNLTETRLVRNQIGQLEERQVKRFIDFSAIFGKDINLYNYENITINETVCSAFDELDNCINESNITTERTIRTERAISYNFIKQGKSWIIEFFNIFDLDPSFIDDTDSNWNTGTFDKMYVRGTGAAANLTGENQSGHFASQIFDAANTNANWTNISVVIESAYGVEIGKYLNDSNLKESSTIGVNTSGLVGLWHFNNESAFKENATGNSDDRVYDFSVDVNPERAASPRNNGTTTNGATINKTNYMLGDGAGEFDGSNDYVQIPRNGESLDLIGTRFTLSAWVNPRTQTISTIVSKPYTTSHTDPFFDWAIIYNAGSDGKPSVFLQCSTGHRYFNSALKTNTWNYVAATYDGSNVRFYLNGAVDGTSAATCSITNTNSQNVRIGSNGAVLGGEVLPGAIDEVAIWNRTLNASEIKNLYLRGALRLNISVRSCDDSACAGESWQLVDNATNSTKKDLVRYNMLKNRYFQYNITYSNFTAYATFLNVNNVSIEYEIESPPIVNTTFNITNPVLNDIINFTGNITDETGLISANITYNISGIITYVNFSLSGTSAQVSNVTKLTCTETCTINFTMFATDTRNNVKQNSTLISVPDTTKPVVNTTFNTTSPRNVDFINFTGNITDGNGLLSANWTVNLSSGKVFMNYTLSGTTAQVSNTTNLRGLAGGTVLNFTLYATDTSNNVKQNSTVFTITDALAPVVNTTFNATNALVDSAVNYTANITDETGLLSANWTVNLSTGKIYANYTLSGTTAQISNSTLLPNCIETCVLNFTMYATDTNNNVKQNSTLLKVNDVTNPIVNTTFNITSPLVNDIINFTGNVTDLGGLLSANITYNISGVITYVNFSLSGTTAQVSNATKLNCVETCVINFTMYATDTSNNVKQNSTLITVADVTNPIVNTTFNITSPLVNDIINFTGNVTDLAGLISANITYNLSGVITYVNFSLSGTTAQVSNATKLNCVETCVINFTMYATDTSNNVKQNSTLITVADVTKPVVNTTTNISNPNLYDIINISANITDGSALISANITYNLSGFLTKVNFTLSGTSAQVSNATKLNTAGVVNFTVYATDSSNNVKQNSTLITVSDNVLPIVNTTFNITSPLVNDVINFTGNITDETQLLSANITYNLSGVITYVNFTGLSGTSAQISNVTKLTCTETCVINFTMYATDTSNNVKQNSTLLTVADVTKPVVNTTFNITSPLVNDIINFTGNVTDLGGLLSANITYNISGVITYVNFTGLSGTSAQISNVTKLTCTETCVINFTMYATDTSNNVKQNSTLITVADVTSPAVRLDSPSNNSFAGGSFMVTFAYTGFDVNLKNCSLYHDYNSTSFNENQTNTTPASGIASSFTISVNESTDNSFIWNVRCYDNPSNNAFNSTNFTVRVDTSSPQDFSLLNPENNTFSRELSPTFNWSQTVEGNFLNYTLQISNGTGFETINYTAVSTVITEPNATATLAVNLPWYWRVIAFDSAGNNATSAFFKYTTDRTDPIITNMSINGNSFTTAQRVNITANCTDNSGNISYVRVEHNGTSQFANSTMTNLNGDIYSYSALFAVGSYNATNIYCSDGAGNTARNSTNFTFKVTAQTITETVTQTTTVSSGGGGGGSLVQVPRIVKLEILIPQPITIYLNDSLILPIIVRNTGELDIKNITLDLINYSADLSISLTETKFNELKINQSISVNAIFKSNAKEPGRTDATFIAEGKYPHIKATSKIYIDIVERFKENKTEVIERTKFLADLFKSNPECLEFSELLKQAEEASRNNEFEKAIALTESAINACRDLLASQQKRLVTEAPKKVFRFRLSIPLIIALILIILALLLYFATNIRRSMPHLRLPKLQKGKGRKIGPTENEVEEINRLLRRGKL